MAIRITRNETGNCINFIGSTNPAYWNACLSAQINAQNPDGVDVINDIISAQEPTTVYEFHNVNYMEFADKDGVTFDTAQEAVDYINANANVTGLSTEVGTDMTGQDINFRLDDTSTTVLLDNGFSYAVNSIKAIAHTDGTVHINAIATGNPTDGTETDRKHLERIEVGRVYVNGTLVSGGINTIVNTLNELFTVGPFEAVVISDPFATMVADVDGTTAGYTLEGNTATDPVGDDIFTNSSSGNYAGLLSTATIDQAGEYFTFDIRGEAQIGFGLVHTQDSFDGGLYNGSSIYADPTTFAVSNSAHYGFQFSHWFHPTPNGSWTNYGASTGFIYGPGWSGWESKDEWLAGSPVKVRVGIDELGFIAISTLQDDGATWILHARTSYPVKEGAEFRLGIKAANSSGRVYTEPKVHLLEPAAPTMNFRWIESPDGNYEYPLFATEEEANYYDQNHAGTTGTGTSHTHTYVDDPTGTTWYMPDTGRIMSGSTPPQDAAHTVFMGNTVTYTEITSLTNADLAPPAFTGSDYTLEEGSSVNIQTSPQDVSYVTTIDISPVGSGMVHMGGGIINGTLTDVGADTTYTVTVTRANSYGSSVGTFTVTATDTTPTTTHDTPWTKALSFDGSSERALQVDSSYYRVPMKMGGINNNVDAPTTAGNTSADADARPWATAVVFNITTYNSNQHIWNLGEGSGTTDDNIYLRRASDRKLYFGWGRQGEVNECLIHPDGTGEGWDMTPGNWYGIYVAHNGTRLGAGHTAADIAACFDIRLMGSSASWATAGYSDANLSTEAAWTAGSFGYRMNREFTGDMTVGGRGANRSFRGKIASFVQTTLVRDTAMPTTAEIEEMIVDPIGWLNDYKVGNPYRLPWFSGPNASFSLNDGSSAYSCAVWLMGDGTNDSYSNMIRNQVHPNDQNYTKLNMISMVSNDIENVTIQGLT